jgi:succinate dehydrogenase / fumarate reductase membrane anchor subunit
MSMRTPLGQVRGLGSAKDGVKHFWHQRLTAVALIPLTIWFLVTVVSLVGADYATAANKLSEPIVAIPFLLLLGAGFYHMKLGVQVVIEDYVPDEAMKIACILLNNFFAAAVGIACVYAVLKLSFSV